MEIMLTLVTNVVKRVYGCPSKVIVIFVPLNQASVFSTGFNIHSPLYNFTKMRPAWAYLFQSDGQMDGQTKRK